MADSRSHPKPRFSPQDLHEIHPTARTVTHHKSLTRIMCKSVFFILFLVAIPLFPSQAPDFINQTLLTKFWELVHLLFIGVAVSYGLFSSRNVDGDFDATQYSSNSNFDDSQSSNYVSRIFHVSPIFEDGYENLSVSDEKNGYHAWNSHYYNRGESNVSASSSGSDEQTKNGPVNYENGSEISLERNENSGEISLERDENSGVQAWNSQYFQGESVVVLSQINYELDEWEKSRQVAGYKPLGLPVRSLKSRIRNPDNSPHFSDGSESGSSLIGASSGSRRSMDGKNFGDMDPQNLEEKFNENFALHSQGQWRSRSERVELREKVGYVAHPSHFRPLSVDETQFESLKSQSFRSTTSFSSQASSMSNSPAMLSPSHSVSSDSPRSRTEELEKNKDFFASYPADSQSPETTKSRDAPLNAFHLRRYSSGSLFQKDLHKHLKEGSKDQSRKRRDGLQSNKESGHCSLEMDKKPVMMVKASPRGKSVRTIRTGVYTAEAAKAGGKAGGLNKAHIDDQAGKGYNEVKAANIGNNEMKREGPVNTSIGITEKNLDTQYDLPKPAFANANLDTKYNEVNMGKTEMKREGFSNLSTSISKKNLDNQYDMAKPTFAKYQVKDKEEPSETVTLESEQDSQSESDKSRLSYDEDAVLDSMSNAGNDPNEVDRKAGEFIAKFREQIRLQKVASVERSKGLRLSGKHLR